MLSTARQAIKADSVRREQEVGEQGVTLKRVDMCAQPDRRPAKAAGHLQEGPRDNGCLLAKARRQTLPNRPAAPAPSWQ
jgi:hypothetical protein